ncbi:MAG: HDOD domain-containing protein [Deltaproteobacteria bacterium]|nr:HDOD domain-containing protein [Deltaproteobacteria bacterium]
MSEAQSSTPPEEFNGRLSTGKDWTEIVAWVNDLPPLPHVASQALVLVEDPDTTAQKLTNLLGQDTALAARVLKIANSAMFACQREITTLNQAIMVIGFKSLKGIIVAATLRQLSRNFGNIEKMIWENSTCTAVGCYQLAQQLKKPYMDEVFLLGLLHDLGKLVLVRQIPKEYQKIVDGVKKGKLFTDVEQDTLGYAHALIGALVAKKWNFSLDTCQVILHHHDPLDDTVTDLQEEKTAVVVAADLIAHQLGFGHPQGYPDPAPEMARALKRIGVAETEHEALLTRVKEAFDQQASVFN